MSYVQQIVVSATGSHEDVVTAVALASVESYRASRHSPGSEQAWTEFLADKFTKTVRRAKREKDIVTAASAPGASLARVGSAIAVAFPPSLDNPDWMKRLQVTGLNREHNRWFFFPRLAPVSATVAVDPRVNMTTGKTAAQAAHVTMAWAISGHPIQEFSFTDDLDHFKALNHRKVGVIRINDAGLTEIDPGTQTVIVGVL